VRWTAEREASEGRVRDEGEEARGWSGLNERSRERYEAGRFVGCRVCMRHRERDGGVSEGLVRERERDARGISIIRIFSHTPHTVTRSDGSRFE
jgi:hypothetical protein